MNFVERIKQSRMHSKIPILIIFACCFFLSVFWFISFFSSAYSQNLFNYFLLFTSTTLFGIYILFFFGREKFTVLPLISVCLRILKSVYSFIYYGRFGMFPLHAIANIIGYGLLVYCVSCGFEKKKLLIVSVTIVILSILICHIVAYSLNIFYLVETILFAILLLIFGLTNNIYPLFENKEKFKNKKKDDDVAFLLEDLNYKLQEGMISEEEYKEQKKKIIESI